MNWFLYDNDLRHERVKILVILFIVKLYAELIFLRRIDF